MSPEDCDKCTGLLDQGQVQVKKLVQKKENLRVGSLNVGTMTAKSRELADLMRRRALRIL